MKSTEAFKTGKIKMKHKDFSDRNNECNSSEFSVLMSIYSKEDPTFLKECLESLVKQTLKADEVILVEDGRISPELLNVINHYRQELNINSISLEKNSGLATALNAGLKNCSFELVARMDTDDVALPNRFEKQIKFITNNPNIDVIGTFAQEIDENNKHGSLRKTVTSHKDIYDNLFTNPFIHPSVVFKKSKILSLNGFDEKLERRQDYDLWFRCAKANMKFANIPEVLLLYRFTRNTHKKQTLRLAIEQGKIGYKGVKSLKQEYWKALACYIPVLRAILPIRVQHILYQILKKVDPKQRKRT